MKNFKMLLAYLLSLILMVSMFTTGATTAFAAESDVTNIVSESSVAKVGNTEYATIDEAIAAWTNNTTLTLLDNVTLSDVITLKSTEYHVLDLGTYTMTAASKKDAIQIENKNRTSASYALDIKADATNPGGITATGKAIVRHSGSAKDRPITRFYGGVFNATYIVHHSGNNGANSPSFYFYGGEFNGIIYTNRSTNIFYGGTFTGNLQMSVDSSAYTLIAGGTFAKLSNMMGSALNSGKFTIGSSKGVYDKEVYIDDNGNYVIAAAEPAQGIEATVAKTPGTNDYLAYSKVATERVLKYTDAKMALEKNNSTSAKVTIYADEIDLADINYKGTIVVPEGHTLTITNAPEGLKVEGNVVIAKAGLAGSGTEADPYQIGSVDDLIKFRDSVNAGETKYNAPGVYVALTADIDMAVINWVGIGSAYIEHGFMGNFDGKGFKIKNLTITNPAVDSDGYAYAGLFAVTEGAEGAENVIKNLTIENVNISTTGHIVAAAIAYPYYTTVENVTVCGNINITGGDYTSGALAYTRRCVNASNVTVSGNAGSTITGRNTVGGVISDIQMNGGLTANYSNFAVSGVKITGNKNVGGISGIISNQSLTGATVKNVELVSSDARVGTVSGSLGGTSTITNVVVENVTGAENMIGATYDKAEDVEAKIGDTYYATFADAIKAAFANAYANNGEKQTVLTAAGENYATLGVWGGIDWTLTADGTLTIAPTKGTSIQIQNRPKQFTVGQWPEAVRYSSKGEGAAIEGWPYDRTAVKTLIIEEGVTSIGSFTAQGFTNLTGEVIIPSTVTYIGQEAFQKSTMTKLTFAKGGTEELCIAQGAFKNLIIEEVTLPDDRPVHLHAWVFNNCHNLKSATLPATLVSVHGTNHIDYFKDFNAHSNPTWTKSSEIFAYNENMETITFGSAAVRDMFYANNNGSDKEYTVANVGLTTYFDLQAAINATENGETVKLIKKVTLKDTLTIPAGKKITLDLNGKTITGTDNATGSFGLITNKGELTITGNGKITLTATNNRGWGAYSSVISNTVGGKLIVESGTIEHLGGTDMAYGIDNLTNGKGTYAETIINGGTIKSTYRAVRQFLNGVEAQNILTINGGTIEGANKSVWMQDPNKNANTGSLTVAEGATLNGDVYLFVTAGSTEYPVEVSIAASAVNGEVLTGNFPANVHLQNNNGTYSTFTAEFGDVNFDGSIDAMDVVIIRKAIIGAIEYEAQYDVNQDGKFNVLDLVRIKKILAPPMNIATDTDGVNNYLANGEEVIILDDFATDSAIVMTNGGVINGNNKAIDATGYYSGNDCAIITTGGTIENLALNLKSNSRGIGSGSTGTYTQTENLYINNVTVDGGLYAINTSGDGDCGLYVTDSKLYGWTSYSNLSIASFNNVTFGLGAAHNPWPNDSIPYGGYMSIYSTTSFTDCNFDENFHIGIGESGLKGVTLIFNSCYYNGTLVTADNFADLLVYPVDFDGDSARYDDITVLVNGSVVFEKYN